MAGVYIKNMGVPNDCASCDLREKTYCKALDGQDVTFALLTGGVYGRCPIEEVPDHGDLIDRSLLEEDGEWNEREDSYVGYSRAQIHGAPVVIPGDAEETK